jgi:hypothetical protein
MSVVSASLPGGTWTMGDLTVTRFGYGAMQLAGPGVMGPPADRDGALAVLREVVELGITHIDTADVYGPHITNELIREALHPYPQVDHASARERGGRGALPLRRRPRRVGHDRPGVGGQPRPRCPTGPASGRVSVADSSHGAGL